MSPGGTLPYGTSPLFSSDAREIAHLEAGGVTGLLIARGGWPRPGQARQNFTEDPAVRRDPGQRDWIELRPGQEPDLRRLARLPSIAAAANA